MGVGEVGIGMALAEILQRNAVANTSSRGPQKIFKHPAGIGASHGMHGIKGQWEVVADQVADLIKVKQLLHQIHEVVHSVDHLHLHRTETVGTGIIDWDGRSFHDRIVLQSLGAGEDCIGVGGRCGAAVGAVHLHAEITIRPAGIVGGGEDDAANGLALTDQVGGGGGGENS